MRAVTVLLLTAAVTLADAVSTQSVPLAKLVYTLSRPGAFNKTHSVFGGELDAPSDVTSCPLGPEGLACRQAEARRVTDNCPRGDGVRCDLCHETSATAWPHCCQRNGLCCSELAKACQTCNVTALQTFCNKHFKRCF